MDDQNDNSLATVGPFLLKETLAKDPNRRPDGTFAPGSKGNPRGGDANRGRQPYYKRIEHLSAKYKPHEIINMARYAPLVKDELGYWDTLAIVHMARAICPELTKTDTGADQVHKERKELLDRVDGPVRQTFAIADERAIIPEDLAAMSDDEIAEAFRTLRNG